MTYRTKQAAHEAGWGEGWEKGYEMGRKDGISEERARLKRKAIVNPLYNRPIDLKERVNREAEVEHAHQMSPEMKREFVDRFTKKQPFSIIRWLTQWRP